MLGRLTLPWLAASFVLTGCTVGPLARFDGSPMSLLQSYRLAGALMLLLLLYLLRSRPPARNPGSPEQHEVEAE